jgi:hypothetical protein
MNTILKSYLLLSLMVGHSMLFAQSVTGSAKLFTEIERTRGFSGPAWGPYSNRYAGIAHKADSLNGIRFDFSVITGHYRGKLVVPNQKFESDWMPWETSSDLNYFSFREEIEWKDKVYSQVAFAPYKGQRLMKLTLVNNTADAQCLAVHYMAGLAYSQGVSPEIKLPHGLIWTRAIDYDSLNYKIARFDDNLRTDGLVRGEIRSAEFIGGSAIGDNFGKTAGDFVKYAVSVTKKISNPRLVIRYKTDKAQKLLLRVNGDTLTVALEPAEKMQLKAINLRREIWVGSNIISFTSLLPSPIIFDGFTMIEANEAESLAIVEKKANPVPSIDKPSGKSILLKYPDLDQFYGICWNDTTPYKIREMYTDELDNAIRNVAADNVYPSNYTRKDAHTLNVFFRTIPLKPNSTKVIYAILLQGSREDIIQCIKDGLDKKEAAEIFAKYENRQGFQVFNPAGLKYVFSQNMLKATLLQNIEYPVYTEKSFNSYLSCGKRFSPIYTNEAGRIGLALAEFDINAANKQLNAFLTDSLSTNAFVQHGTVYPTLFFLFQEIWNRTQSREFLASYYPKLKRYYNFFTGQDGISTTATMKSGLLRTFDYFYNSGGWDDYPAQVYMHANASKPSTQAVLHSSYANEIKEQKLSKVTTPAVSASMAIRIGKTMAYAAAILGRKDDVAAYKKDIQRFTDALQKLSWDEASGYFGYVVHDPGTFNPTGILRLEDGTNCNLGLDGLYPLVAGIMTPHQKSLALERIFSPSRCWTPLGISVVDQSAPNFRMDGYWNGTVWFCHQWTFWKTMLDLGELEKANQIAFKALDIYSKYVDSTYYTPELFRLENMSGAGWKHFSGLSSPLINWFASYYIPGTLTTGFDVMVMAQKFSETKDRFEGEFELKNIQNETPAIIICMKQGLKYKTTINGKSIVVSEIVPGCFQLKADYGLGKIMNLKIEPVQ